MTAISTGALSASPLGAGAIIGAMVVAAAFLAGFAVYRRSAGAVCALLMVIAAGVLEFSVLGVLVVPSSPVLVLLEGLFGAAALVFLSSVIRPARHNALLGGVMFAAALSLVGLGVMNLLAPGDAGRLMRFGVVGVGVFAVILAGVQAPRDPGARLILPGAVIALAAPLIGHFLSGSGVAIVPHILFTLGVVAASLVALTEAPAARRATSVLSHDLAADGFSGSHGAPRAEVQPEQSLLLSENQLAQVLDYNGVAVWDWSPAASHQTDSLAGLVGAGNRATLSPQTMRNFLHGDDAAQFDSRVLGAGEPRDAAFDCTLRVNDGRALRMRGARAVNEAGAIERLVAFIENAPQEQKTAKTGAPAPKDPLVAAFADALAKGEIGLAFQPIVALDGAKVVGFEALARWRDADGAEKTGAENLVRAAESAGQGGALAMLALNAAASHLAAEMKTQKRRDLFAAMNLSFAQMREPGFASAVKKTMKEFDLPAKSIVLELTESQEIKDPAAGLVFTALKGAGAALAFDDFGAGFTSLGNLQKYAFDYLKIDKSFIDGLVAGEEGAKIARAIAGLGRDLGLTVIAEGVETKETAEAARAIGCALGQGFAFGSPVTAPEKSAETSAASAPAPVPAAAASSPAKDDNPPHHDKWRRRMR